MPRPILRHFRDRTNAIRVPRRLRALQAKIYAVGGELEQSNGRSARPSEIAERLGVELEVVIEGLAAQGIGRPSSLDEPDRDAEGASGRLRFFDGLTQSEVGARVGISQMQVSRMLTQTLGRLRRQLTADGPGISAVAG